MGLKIILIFFAVFSLGLIMSMLGRGGGNFYVPVLVAAGISMNTAATNAQPNKEKTANQEKTIWILVSFFRTIQLSSESLADYPINRCSRIFCRHDRDFRRKF